MKSIIVKLFPILLLISSSVGHQPVTGEWWASASDSSKNAFVGGYLDCYVYDAERAREGLNMTTELWSAQVSAFYLDHPTDGSLTVESVLSGLLRNRRFPRANPGDGETVTHKGKHATFDSELWRTRFPEERLGYVEGYLSCQRVFGKPEGTFSKTDSWYVNKISEWYGLKPGTDEIDPHKAYAMIADVLYSFRDSQVAPPTAATVPTPVKP